MKRVFCSFLFVSMIFVFWVSQGLAYEASDKRGSDGVSKVLVAYFSVPETSNPGNMSVDEDNSVVVINGEVLGNTQYVAYVIRDNMKADIFRIEPKTAYTTDHRALVDMARREQDQNLRPAISGRVENMEEYDTVFLGYPTWFSDLPMILYSFLEGYDLAGKRVIPFNTHGGSGFSGTIQTIAALQPNAIVVRNGFTVSRNYVEEAEKDVVVWLKELGY